MCVCVCACVFVCLQKCIGCDVHAYVWRVWGGREIEICMFHAHSCCSRRYIQHPPVRKLPCQLNPPPPPPWPLPVPPPTPQTPTAESVPRYCVFCTRSMLRAAGHPKLAAMRAASAAPAVGPSLLARAWPLPPPRPLTRRGDSGIVRREGGAGGRAEVEEEGVH